MNATVIPGNVTAQNCFSFGDDVSQGVAGVNGTFFIQAADEYGNKQTSGSEGLP